MKTRNCILALAGIVVGGVLFVSAQNLIKAKSLGDVLGAPDLSETSIPSQVLADGPIRYVRFTLFDQGIRPAELRIKAGLVNLAVEDKSTNSDGLIVQHLVAGQPVVVAVVRNLANQRRGRNIIRVLPGTYHLQDALRPANKAVVTVEP